MIQIECFTLGLQTYALQFAKLA